MRDDLLLYYERELNFLRQLGAEFAGKHPKIAGRLLLDPDKGDTEDPHVEKERIREVLSGNVCRCTGYVPIVDAVYEARAAYGKTK